MTPGELLRLARAVGIVLADSERTEEIHVTEELTGRSHFARLREELFSDAEGASLLLDRAELRGDQVDYEGLRRLPKQSLGFQYVDHLDRNGLSADSQAAPTTHVTDPDTAYLMRRFRQTHDVWHALTDLGTAGHEEVILHAFSFGQLRLPVSALVVIFGSLKHLVLERRWGALSRALWEAWQSGRNAQPLLPVYFERYWEEPMQRFRRRLQLVPSTRTWVDS